MDERETDLILRSQQGDQEAFKQIFEVYRQKVYRVAYGVVRQRDDALEIVQDVFIKLFISIKKFKGESKFYTYLYRMTMNAAIDYARKLKKTSAVPMDDGLSQVLADGAGKRPDRLFFDKELEEKVKQALGKLPEEQRAALIFREVEGLSYQEMAEVMSCSMGTVMSRLHYGRKKMQDLLTGYLKGGGKG